MTKAVLKRERGADGLRASGVRPGYERAADREKAACERAWGAERARTGCRAAWDGAEGVDILICTQLYIYIYTSIYMTLAHGHTHIIYIHKYVCVHSYIRISI